MAPRCEPTHGSRGRDPDAALRPSSKQRHHKRSRGYRTWHHTGSKIDAEVDFAPAELTSRLLERWAAGVKCRKQRPALDRRSGVTGQLVSGGIEVDATDIVTEGPPSPGVDCKVEACKVLAFAVEGAVSLVVIVKASSSTLESAVGVVASLPRRLMAGVEPLIPVGTRSRLFGGIAEGSFKRAAVSPRRGRKPESKVPDRVAVIVHRAACCGKHRTARRGRLDR